MADSPRILILGANGRLGRALDRVYTRKGLNITSWKRTDLDITRLDTIPTALDSVPFDLLINAAGLTDVDACETRRQEASLSNALAPGMFAEYCANNRRRFIHISSDYVFSGAHASPLSESDPTGPCNHYGQTKLDGETATLTACPSALVIRVSWLFGPDKPSFPDMILRTALAGDHVAAVNDKWSSPSYSDDLADWLLTLIQKHPDQAGLLHLCNEGAPTWQEYGQTTLDIAKSLGFPLKAHTVDGHSMQGFAPFKANRPPHTALDTSKFQALTGLKPRPWQAALEAYLRSLPR